MRRILLALALLLGVVAQGYGATIMLSGPTLNISNATNATPIVLTTASNTLSANDWVRVVGVQGNPAANGIWQCSAVTSTSCTLSGSVGGGTYTIGGTLVPLGVTATATSAWFDISKCDKAYVYVYSVGGATGTVNIEATPMGTAAAPSSGPTTPPFVLKVITNPPVAGSTCLPPTDCGYYSVPVMSQVRINVTTLSAGTVYATLEGFKAGTRIW